MEELLESLEKTLWPFESLQLRMSATDRSEREQRNLARELRLDLPKLESLRELFNSCDDDRSGFIEWPVPWS